MDQCYGLQGSPLAVEELIMPNIPTDFDARKLIRLLQCMFVYEIAYLDGASLLESTHQCIFSWEDALLHLRLEDPLSYILYVYSQSMQKSLYHVMKCVLNADLYEGMLSAFINMILRLSYSDFKLTFR